MVVVVVVRLLPSVRDHSSLFQKPLDTTLLRFIIMLCGTDNIPQNIVMDLNNVMNKVVSTSPKTTT